LISLVQALLRGRFLFLTFLSALVLAGCQTLPPELAGLKDTWAINFQSYRIDVSKLPTSHEFAIVHAGVRPALVALGQRIKTNTPQGEVVDEYWYSSDRELLVLRNGRIHTVWGMPIEWRDNQSEPPSWQQVLSTSQVNSWQRVRQEMPNYRVGIQDAISTQVLNNPPTLDGFATELMSDISPSVKANLKWVQDRIETTNNLGAHWSFTQVFAIDQNQVIYSEQCIAHNLCVRFKKLKP
jgi:hypothetical protein